MMSPMIIDRATSISRTSKRQSEVWCRVCCSPWLQLKALHAFIRVMVHSSLSRWAVVRTSTSVFGKSIDIEYTDWF